MGEQTTVVHVDEDLADLIPEFLENRRRDVEQITRLAQEGKRGELTWLGHTMKGGRRQLWVYKDQRDRAGNRGGQCARHK